MQLFKEANRMLHKLDEEGFQTHALFRLIEANSEENDLWLEETRFPCLRQQTKREGDFYLCLADFVRPRSQNIKDKIGIFATFIVVQADIPGFGFTPAQAGSIGIIGGADGPTAIFLTSKLAPELLGPIAVAAYSYMALVPVIQPPIMKALTTKKERLIRMSQLRTVSKKEKIIFPIVVAIIVTLVVPSSGTLIGSLMLGNLMKECGVVDRLSKTAQNELNNIVVIFLGITVGATATAQSFLNLQTIGILAVGIVAFGVGSASGVLMAKFMNLFLKEGSKINPLIGSAGVSAVPMAARVSQQEGQKEDRRNFLLMHAMGPNVAGVIGSAVAAGILLSFLG
jgi:oxaloacetate decarboxylase beta subunit